MINKYLISSIVIIFFMEGCREEKGQITENEVTPAKSENIVEMTKAQLKNAEISTGMAELVNTGTTIKLNGKTEIMPENIITVSAPMAGFIKSIKMSPGMIIQKGQNLVTLEDKEFIQLQQDFLSAKNAYDFAKMDYERQLALSKSQAASDKAVQNAEEKMKHELVLMKSLTEKLRLIGISTLSLNPENLKAYIQVTASVSGMITSVNANTGKYVQVGEELLKMYSHKGLKIVLNVVEKDLASLERGQKVKAFTNFQPENKILGTIEYIVSEVGPEGFAHVICAIQDSPDLLIPGMYINAEVESKNREVWVVPEEAVVNFEGKEFIFIETSEGKFEQTEAIIGKKENGKTEIINFQNFIGKNLVFKNAYTVLMKMKNVGDE
jgi:cobalt-zinc-cadmium efflux system membrane fusion protein